QFDMGGNVSEYIRDGAIVDVDVFYYPTTPAACVDCVSNGNAVFTRPMGGDVGGDAATMMSPAVGNDAYWGNRASTLGFRCASSL
ncbi:MAG TPA: hypothetical protein VJV79_15100, partial [Polyangiaceae bacterium]|nr:hypothetical protein [Polyangiaceae bacterium]